MRTTTRNDGADTCQDQTHGHRKGHRVSSSQPASANRRRLPRLALVASGGDAWWVGVFGAVILVGYGIIPTLHQHASFGQV
jgi:hypothetical protein